MSRQNDIKKLIRAHTRRVQILKEQRALHGITVDPKIIIEIEDIEAVLAELAAELNEIEPSATDSLQLNTTGSGTDHAKSQRAGDTNNQNQPQPQPPPKQPVWSASAWGKPASIEPLVLADQVWLGRQDGSGLRTDHSRLVRLDLATGREQGYQHFDDAFLTGFAKVTGVDAGLSGPSVAALLTTATTDALKNNGRLYAVNAKGEPVWHWPDEPRYAMVSAPTVAGSVVWVTTNTQHLIGLDVATGQVQREILLTKPPSIAAPAIAAGIAYIPLKESALAVVHLGDQQQQIWSVPEQGLSFNQTPVSVGDTLIAVGNRLRQGGVFAFRLADGALQWPTSLDANSYGLHQPVLGEGMIYVSAGDALYALNTVSGEIVWRFAASRSIRAAPVLVEDTLYVTSHDHRLYALDAATGVQRWSYEVERRIETAPLITAPPNPLAIIADAGGTVTAIRRPLRPQEAQRVGQDWLHVEVEADTLTFNAWSHLRFRVRNQGSAMARNLMIRLQGGQFEGAVAQTQRIASLLPGNAFEDRLDARPLAFGDVPLRIAVAFQDALDHTYTWRNTHYVSVAKDDQHVEASETSPYALVDIRIRQQDERGYPVELNLQGQQEFEGYMSPDVLGWVAGITANQSGEALFNHLFADQTLRQHWAQIRGQHAQRRIRFRIDAAAPELHTLPWELLRDASSGETLAASRAAPFSRYVAGSWQYGQPITARPVKLAVAIADPENLAEFDLAAIDRGVELDLLRNALAGSAVELIDVSQPCTLSAIRQALDAGVHLLHLVCHGRISQRNKEAQLLLADADNQVAFVSETDFVSMLRHELMEASALFDDQLRFIFLAGCQTATRSSVDAFRGIAPQLVNAGVSAILAMQDVVSVETVQTFTQAFYQQLFAHGQVDLACNQARANLMAAKIPGGGIPVLFSRLPDNQLISLS